MIPLLALVLLPSLGAEEIPFAALGEALLKVADAKRPAADAVPSESEPGARFLHRVLPISYRLPLGAFELWYLRETVKAAGGKAEPVSIDVIRTRADELLRLEQLWVDRLAVDEKQRSAGKKDLATLSVWIRGWKQGQALEPTPSAAAALAELATILGAKVGANGVFAPAPALFVAPSRVDFATLIGAASIVDPTEKVRLEAADARTWTSTGLLRGIALVATSWGPPGTDGSPLLDNAMPNIEAAGNVVHRASHLAANNIAPELAPWFLEGIAILDTVDVTKADETRCMSGTEGSLVAEKAGFMPGQIGDFRLYPGVPAEKSPFRRGPSASFFVKELKRAHAQEGGFKLLDFDTGKATTEPGPFLLPREKSPPSVEKGPKGLQSGYAEFFRAYVGAFAHYLDTQRAEKRQLLAALLQDLRETRKKGALPETALHDALKKLTGKTLGAGGGDGKKDLEAAFVAWLATGG